MKIQREQLQEWWKKPQNRLFAGSLAVMLVLIVISAFIRSEAPTDTPDEFSADTIIPDGYVLVPIEIENKDSLTSLIGQFGLVDLFATTHEGRRIRVAKRLKLLRAPLNPEQFAVLVAEDQAQQVLDVEGAFYVVVQNPQALASSQLQKKVSKRSRIEYDNGGNQ